MSLKKQAIHAMSWSLADKLVNQVAGFFVMAYLAKLLGPQSFGLIGMLAVFIAISESLVNSGFSQALVQKSNGATDRDFSTVFIINLAISIVLYLLLFGAAPAIATFYSEPLLLDAARALFLVIIINAFGVVVKAKLAISIDFKSVAVANTVSTLVGAAVGLYLASEEYRHWSLVGMTLSKSLLNVLVLWCFCRWTPQLTFSWESFKVLFGFGSRLLVAGIIAQLVNNLYVLLIGRYFSATQVGFLTQSKTLTDRASGLINSVLQGVTYPVMTSVNNDQERMVSIYKRLIEASMLVSFPAMIGFAAIADPFVRWFLGDEWLPVIPVIVILSLARSITPISSVNLNVLNAIGRSDLFLRVDLVKLPMTLVGVVVSAPFGVMAVAFSMLITTAISFFINAYYPGKLFGFGALGQLKVASRLIVATLVMLVSVLFIEHNNPLAEILIKSITGAAIYCLMLFFLRVEVFTDNVKTLFSRLSHFI